MGNGINYPKLRVNADFANFILDVLYASDKECNSTFSIKELRDILYPERILQKYLVGFRYAGVLEATRTNTVVQYNFTTESINYMLKHRDMFRIRVTKSADKWLRNKYMSHLELIHSNFGTNPFDAVNLSEASGNKVTSCLIVTGNLHSASFIKPLDELRKTHPNKKYMLTDIAVQAIVENVG